MLIPEFSPNIKTPTLNLINSVEEFDKLRQQTTDKLLLTLVTAEWDSSSQILKQMIDEMPNNFA